MSLGGVAIACTVPEACCISIKGIAIVSKREEEPLATAVTACFEGSGTERKKPLVAHDGSDFEGKGIDVDIFNTGEVKAIPVHIEGFTGDVLSLLSPGSWLLPRIIVSALHNLALAALGTLGEHFGFCRIIPILY